MFIQLQITYPSREDAQEAAKYLVSSRLVACAQIVADVESRYVWQGKTCVDTEMLLLCKTREELFETVAEEVSKRHPYDCPQIVALPIAFISASYAAWLDENIKR